MANIIIAGSSAVLKSSIKLETMKKLEKYAPEALCKRDDKERLTFKIGVASEGTGTIAEKGVFFAPVTHDAEGRATVTLAIPTAVKDAKEWAAETLAHVYNELASMEGVMNTASTKVDEDKKAMLEKISVQ